jgi:hypothetical protein
MSKLLDLAESEHITLQELFEHPYPDFRRRALDVLALTKEAIHLRW